MAKDSTSLFLPTTTSDHPTPRKSSLRKTYIFYYVEDDEIVSDAKKIIVCLNCNPKV